MQVFLNLILNAEQAIREVRDKGHAADSFEQRGEIRAGDVSG